MDAKIDITDIYAFQKPGDPSKSILIMNVNPLAPTLANQFEHNAIYEVLIDTNGDAVADISFRITYSTFADGKQFATVRRATGADAATNGQDGAIIIANAPVSFNSTPHITESGPYKFFAGLRSDPFFFDLMGFLNGFHFTGSDFFLTLNVFGQVLELPNSALGTNPNIGVWARVLHNENGTLDQADRMGRPAINTVFNHGNDKNRFNEVDPTQDRKLFTPNIVAVLNFFGYSQAQQTQIANILLPDILTYDFNSASGFLNGRQLADDVIDTELALVTNGQITSDGVGPHTDYLSVFPYLGTPH
jgi:hypothetical protein